MQWKHIDHILHLPVTLATSLQPLPLPLPTSSSAASPSAYASLLLELARFYSYTMAKEGLWNITAPNPRAKPEGEGGLYSIIPRLPRYNYFIP